MSFIHMEKDDLLVQLGIRIKELRKMKNMTQAELAHAIAKDQQSIQRLEAGKSYKKSRCDCS